jgi:isoquinoline 1-oxidoreductase beta subunit
MKLTRRKFIVGSSIVGGGLVLGFTLLSKPPVPGIREETFQPNAFLQITPDDKVIFQLAKAEMGQGVYMGLTTIVGEELDYNPANIIVELAGVHPDFGLQVTGGSMSIATSWEPLREAGAMARAMLIQAAAQHWSVSVDALTTDDGQVINLSSGEKISYGDLVNDAKLIDSNLDYKLKDKSDYRWIGQTMPRNDSFIKSTGKAEYGIDVDLPGMQIAVVVRPPQFGGSLLSWDANAIREMEGIHHAFEIHTGIAIIADSYWQARKAAKAMKVEWNKGQGAGLNSEDIKSSYQQALEDEDVHIVLDEGDIEAGLNSATSVIEAEYAAPFLAHNTMEPQNATAYVQGAHCEMWVPSQSPDVTRAVVAHFTGFDQENITVHSTFLGGGFGRRSFVDFAGEVAVIAKQTPDIPVKLIWSREDDIQHDFYRPASYHRIKGGLDEKDELVAWQHKVISNSIMKGVLPDMLSMALPDFVPVEVGRSIGRFAGDIIEERDPTMSEGAEIPYSVENMMLSQKNITTGIPVGFWRSVGHSHTAFVCESFMDEMAHSAKNDPAEFRRRHLKDKPQHLTVLDLAIEKSNWGVKNNDSYQGIAVHESFDSFVAMVIDVSVENKRYSVEKVVAAVDCGLVINPDIVRAQIEGSIVYGLGGAMLDPVTIEDGAIKQSNFHDAPVLRMNEIPKMEVYIVDSDEPPTGIGEPGLPPVAPALANALFAATGQRLRELPLKLS